MRNFDKDHISLLRLLLQVHCAGRKAASPAPLAPDGDGSRAGAPDASTESAGEPPKKRSKGSGCDAVQRFRELHWHAQSLAGKERETWAPVLDAFLAALAEASFHWQPDRKELEGDIGRLECNLFTVNTQDGVSIGSALYHAAALALNHCCDPNCYVVDGEGASSDVLRAIACKRIEPGEELRISYIDVEDPGPVRRRDLKQQYNFECGCVRCKEELESGERSRCSKTANSGASTAVAMVAHVTHDLLSSSPLQLAGQLREMFDDDRSNAAVVGPGGWPGGVDIDALTKWASALSALGDDVTDTLYYWQGYKARQGEPPRVQLLRQIADDFREMAEAVADDRPGKDIGVDIANGPGLAALQALVGALVDVCEAAPLSKCPKAGLSSRTRGYCLKIGINEGGATKFHDDWFTARLEVPLTSAATVLAQNPSVDWAFWDQCAGQLDLESEGGKDVNAKTAAWNKRVCPTENELTPVAGSLVAMKGSSLVERPCIHRSGANGKHSFTVTLEKMTEPEMQKQRDMMDFDEEDE